MAGECKDAPALAGVAQASYALEGTKAPASGCALRRYAMGDALVRGNYVFALGAGAGTRCVHVAGLGGASMLIDLATNSIVRAAVRRRRD